MRALHTITVLTVLITWSATAFAGDIRRAIIAEVDPIAPASAAFEDSTYGVATSKWGVNVDFNAGSYLSTGPQLWLGTFNVKGPEDVDYVRREDFQPGERHKLDATRLRWHFTRWQKTSSMRGWYVSGGYSYTRIDSRANRQTEESDANDAFPEGILYKAPDDETDLITDVRHGVFVGCGNRWNFFDHSMTVTIGTSITSNFKRTVSIDSKDAMAQTDYDDLIEDLPNTKMSVRPMPEANLGLGWAW